MKKYRTTRDIVVPAGTEVGTPPTASTRWGKDHEAVVALDNDHTAYLSMDLAEGLEAGAIEEVV
jgi:hypothetical protein